MTDEASPTLAMAAFGVIGPPRQSWLENTLNSMTDQPSPMSPVKVAGVMRQAVGGEA